MSPQCCQCNGKGRCVGCSWGEPYKNCTPSHNGRHENLDGALACGVMFHSTCLPTWTTSLQRAKTVAEATELMGRMNVDRGGDYVLSSPDPLQHSKRKGGSGEYSTFLCLFEISVVQSDWLIWQFFPPVLSLIPRHHPVRISLPVQCTGKPHAILKAIHTGVGFGSGTETNLYWASLTQTTYLYSSHLYRPP